MLPLHKQQFESSAPASSAEPSYFDDLITWAWSAVAVWIGLAGAAYPSAVGLIALIVYVATETVSYPRFGDIAITAPFFVIFGGFVGFVWSSFVALFTLPAVYIVILSLRLRVSVVRLGAFAGGLVGFVSLFPLLLLNDDRKLHNPVIELIVPLVIGPGLTTVLGQIGGARGGLSAARIISAKMAARRKLVELAGPKYQKQFEECAEPIDEGVDPVRFRFRIVHLLWVSVWLSLFFALVRLSRIPFEFFLPLVIGWAIFQSATMILGGWLIPRVARWWNGEPQTRST